MVDVGDHAIQARARMADALAEIIAADPRVRRWQQLDFQDDGGVVLVVELYGESEAISKQTIARELEGLATVALPALAWVRVQVT
jgi:hypothetical protein